MSRYSCSLDGKCEPQLLGQYESLEECKQLCQYSPLGYDEKEAIFLTLSYQPEMAFQLTTSDLKDYIRREYQVTVLDDERSQVINTFYDLLSDNYLGLYRLDYADYVERNVSVLDLFIIKTIYTVSDVGDINLVKLHYNTLELIQLLINRKREIILDLQTVKIVYNNIIATARTFSKNVGVAVENIEVPEDIVLLWTEVVNSILT